MKKTLIKTIAVSSIIAGFGTASVFARSNKNVNPYNHPMGPDSEKGFEYHHSENGRMNHRLPVNGFSMFNPMHGADILGTVTSIDDNKQLITVKDADGNETKVHVNPFTRLVQFEKPAERTADTADKRRELPCLEDAGINLKDVKTGNWVAVKKFNTETKTIEAGHIIVVQQ